MKHRHLYRNRKTFDNARRILRQTGTLPRTNAQCEQRRGKSDVLAAVQGSPSIYTKIIQNDW